MFMSIHADDGLVQAYHSLFCMERVRFSVVILNLQYLIAFLKMLQFVVQYPNYNVKQR